MCEASPYCYNLAHTVLLKCEMKRNEAKWSEMKRNEDEMKRNEYEMKRNEDKMKRNEAE